MIDPYSNKGIIGQASIGINPLLTVVSQFELTPNLRGVAREATLGHGES